jgi:hypothetical protein
MPVQINEMIIKANIIEPDEKEKKTEEKSSGSAGGNKEEIIKECVEQIMEILNNKNQR